MLGPALMDSAFEGQVTSSDLIAKDEHRGVVVRTMQYLFQQAPEAQIFLSYVQIYQERCYDLLQPPNVPSKPLKVREDPQKKPGQNVNVFVEDLSEVRVGNLEECLEYLMAGFGNVALRSTHYNEQSSRAHCILTLTLRQQLPDQRIRESKLRLVDLAGNERWVIHGPQISPQHARELATINKSLHILGSCLQTLSQPVTTNRRGQELVKHVPYRDSTLTQLLRDSLAGNSYTLMICTICCSILYQMQTLSTLRFADRVKRVKMRATICDTVDPAEQQQQIQAEVEYLRSAVSGAASGNVQELKQKVSELRKACLGLEGENRVLREQIAELEKQPVPMKSTMKKAAARVRRANSEPSLPTPDPWFDHEDLGDLQAIYYRSHDDLGSRMAGSCPKGHRLDSLGSIAHPLPAAANAAYFEWHCDRPGCRGSSRQLDLGRFHCSLCQHDLCQVCYDQLVGKSYSKVDVHAHRARRKPPANSPPSPVARARVEGVERRPEPERRQPRPAFRAAPAPARSAPAPPPGKSAPSRTPRGPEEPKGPEKPPYILRLEESARAFARAERSAAQRPTPRSAAHGGTAPASGASIGSASTASTTPESVRKRVKGRRDGRAPQSERNSSSLPPVHARTPLREIPNSERGVRRKEPDSYYYRHPDIPLRDAIFLPALEEDWQGQRASPHKASSPQLWTRAPAPAAPAAPTALAPQAPAAPAAGGGSRKPLALKVPDAVDMRTLLGELDAKHAMQEP
ncbi:unnamed protein product [Durusdinium trenchii]